MAFLVTASLNRGGGGLVVWSLWVSHNPTQLRKSTLSQRKNGVISPRPSGQLLNLPCPISGQGWCLRPSPRPTEEGSAPPLAEAILRLHP